MSTYRWMLFLALAMSALSGCKRKAAGGGDECSAACAAAGCNPEAECRQACERKHRESAEGGCEGAWKKYLQCVGKPRQKFDGKGSLLCSSGAEASACTSAREAYDTCAGACAHAGAEEVIQREVSGAQVQTRIVKNGCQTCAAALEKAKGGGEHGSPCTSYSVCATACCECDDSHATFSVQSCVNGQCQLGEAACVTARNLRGEMPICAGPSSVRPTTPGAQEAFESQMSTSPPPQPAVGPSAAAPATPPPASTAASSPAAAASARIVPASP